jgi:hypothetical protein
VTRRLGSKPVLRIRDPVPYLLLDPGSGIGFSGSKIPDLGARIPNSYFGELSDNFLGKIFSAFPFCEIYDKKGMTTNFFSPLPF